MMIDRRLDQLSVNLLKAQSYLNKVKFHVDLNRRSTLHAFAALRRRYYEAYWKNAATALSAEIENIGFDYFRIRKGDRWTIVRLGEVMLDDHLSIQVADNKALTHKLIKELGCYAIPSYLEFDLSSTDKALKFLHEKNDYVVVKPLGGTGAGYGVTTKIKTDRQLKQASKMAAIFYNSLIVEEEVKGDSFRLIFLDGEYIDAVKRESPKLIGDGKRTIKKLMLGENIKRLENKNTTSLNPLMLDLDCLNTLRTEQKNPSTILVSEEELRVKTAVNQNSAIENHVVRDVVHDSIIRLGQKICRALEYKLIGFDIITPDITVPLEESGGVINEINTRPGLHHHDLVKQQGQKQALAEIILEYIFSKTQKRVYFT